ncbi:MAG: hypothetical protein CMJ51_00710 [Planctomycetaceae bacterium]|nr:hypothetical protein [Planctomycetaceae bacterium]
MNRRRDAETTPAHRAIRRQFEFAGDSAAARLDRLEILLCDIEPTGAYPLDWLVYRVTGVKSDVSNDPDGIDGKRLQGDLADLIDEIDRSLGPSPFDPDRHLDAEEAAKRLGISRRTLQRWRRLGLATRRFVHPGGAVRAGIRNEAVRRFAERNPGRLQRARRRQPIDEAERSMIREAFDRWVGEASSTTAAIERIAEEMHRSPAAIRAIIEPSARPARAGPQARKVIGRLVARARRQGIPVADIAARIDRSEATVRRYELEARWAEVRSIDPPMVSVPNLGRTDAPEVFTVAGLIDDLPRELQRADPTTWLARVRRLPQMEEDEEVRGRIAAMHFARARARSSVDELNLGRAFAGPRPPGERGLDPIETDLRWWGLLLERNTVSGLAAGLQRLEQSIGRRLEQLPGARVESLLMILLEGTVEVVLGFDPARRTEGHDLARAVGLGVSRRIAREHLAEVTAGARARGIRRATMPIDTLHAVPVGVRRLLSVERWWRRAEEAGVAQEIREDPGWLATAMRFGLASAGRPYSLAETGRELGIPPTRLVGRIDACVARIRGIRKSSDGFEHPPVA